jgi:hypothetical protein
VLSAGKIAPMAVERGLFLTRAGQWIKKAESEIKEPGL